MADPPRAEAATQASFYASATGSGSTCSLAAPCSLSGVQAKVRTVNGSMTGDVYVYLRGGTYTQSSSLAFNASDSGTNGYRVYYKNYPDETSDISGGVDLTTGWTLHDASKNIYQRSVGSLNFRQLYVNNSRAIRARTPDLTDTNTFGTFNNVVSAHLADSTDPTSYFKINASEAPSSVTSGMEMVIDPVFYQYRLLVSSITTDSTNTYSKVFYSAPGDSYVFFKGASFVNNPPYYFENSYQFFNAPGEFFLDPSALTLYYVPRTGETMNSIPIVAPQAENLLI